MKKTVKIIVNVLIVTALTLSMQSCEMFGLEFQTDYVNIPAPVKEELGITAYQFVESRKDIDMALTLEAINKAELQSLYETDSLTYFMINDVQFASWLTLKKYSSIATAPKSELQKMLKGYVVKGLYHSLTMSMTPIRVTTENGVDVIEMRRQPQLSSASNIYLVQAAYVPTSGTISYKSVNSSNLKPTNGIIHVLSNRF